MAADWLQVEYRLRVMALLAVRCAVECHQLAGEKRFATDTYFQSSEPPLSIMLKRIYR